MLMAETGCKLADLVVRKDAILGEGAIWHADFKKLLWVDIEGKKLHIYDPDSGENEEMNLSGKPGTIVPAPGSNLLVALNTGIYMLELQTRKTSFIVDPEEDKPENRFNDGKCDPQGRFWVGSMHKWGDQGKGSVYTLESDGSYRKVIPIISIPNGFCWSADIRCFYLADSPTRQVTCFQYDQFTGKISDPKVVIQLDEEEGFPDGMTTDQEGMIWIAQYGAGRVGRWNPDTGEKLDQVDIPVPKVTSCAFGGENLDQLYITTASQGLTDEELTNYPESGSLFMVRPGVTGVPANVFSRRSSHTG